MREVHDKNGAVVKEGDIVRISTIQIQGEYRVHTEKYHTAIELVVDIPSGRGRQFSMLYMFHPYSFELIKTDKTVPKIGLPQTRCICTTFRWKTEDRAKPHHPDCLMLQAAKSLMVSGVATRIPSAIGPNLTAYFEVKQTTGWSDEAILSITAERNLTIEELRKEISAGKL